MNEPTISKDVAELEFRRFLEAIDLDPSEDTDADDKQGFAEHKRVIIKAMMSSKLVINDKNEPEFRPSDGGTPIRFREPTGASLMAQDSRKEGHTYARAYATLAAVTGENVPRFSGMSVRDLKVCTAVLALFLA